MSIYPWTVDPEENRVQVEEAKATQAFKRVEPGAAGCWIDGHIGHYLSAEIILTAECYGWKDSDAINAAYRYWGNDNDEDLFEYVYDAADDAIDWMNEHVAPEGYAFQCEDGEFFLSPITDFEGTEERFDPQWFVD